MTEEHINLLVTKINNKGLLPIVVNTICDKLDIKELQLNIYKCTENNWIFNLVNDEEPTKQFTSGTLLASTIDSAHFEASVNYNTHNDNINVWCRIYVKFIDGRRIGHTVLEFDISCKTKQVTIK